jgi:hypothetical protein
MPNQLCVTINWDTVATSFVGAIAVTFVVTTTRLLGKTVTVERIKQTARNPLVNRILAVFSEIIGYVIIPWEGYKLHSAGTNSERLLNWLYLLGFAGSRFYFGIMHLTK